jgi:hypothetical protein
LNRDGRDAISVGQQGARVWLHKPGAAVASPWRSP